MITTRAPDGANKIYVKQPTTEKIAVQDIYTNSVT